MSSKPVLCTPLCPFRAFYCAKKALVIKRRGRDLEAFCRWTGDACIGPKCAFAICTRHALQPDGTCGLLTFKKRSRLPSIEEEAAKIEREMVKIKDKLKKLGVGLEDLD